MMDLNNTVGAVYGTFGAVSNFFDNLGITLQVILVIIGAMEIIFTFFLPQSAIFKIPKIFRMINAIIETVDYLKKGFKKIEESRGGLSLQKERNEADYIKAESDADKTSSTV